MDYRVNVEEVLAKKAKDNVRGMVTTTQIRLLMSNAVVVKNKIAMLDKDITALPQDIQSEIKYLLIKHIYQCGRDKDVKNFDTEFHIKEGLQSIGSSRVKYEEFYRYLEEIVAYTKYYKG